MKDSVPPKNTNDNPQGQSLPENPYASPKCDEGPVKPVKPAKSPLEKAISRRQALRRMLTDAGVYLMTDKAQIELVRPPPGDVQRIAMNVAVTAAADAYLQATDRILRVEQAKKKPGSDDIGR